MSRLEATTARKVVFQGASVLANLIGSIGSRHRGAAALAAPRATGYSGLGQRRSMTNVERGALRQQMAGTASSQSSLTAVLGRPRPGVESQLSGALANSQSRPVADAQGGARMAALRVLEFRLPNFAFTFTRWLQCRASRLVRGVSPPPVPACVRHAQGCRAAAAGRGGTEAERCPCHHVSIWRKSPPKPRRSSCS